MKATFAIATLLATLAAASPAHSGNMLPHEARAITPDQFWKRWCAPDPVENPVCPLGAFWCGPADGDGQCIPCGQSC